tara:strand:+ start:5097 stop:6851 length:1755 start_codon:yes stop_codon:yes gene_type:complete
MNQLNLIQKLKLQPRLGVITPPGGGTGDVSTLFGADFETWEKLRKATVKANLAQTEFFDSSTSQSAKYLDGMSKVVGANELLAGRIKGLTENARVFEERNSALNKSFGVTSVGAAKLSEKFAKMATDMNLGLENVKKYGINIKKIIPFQKGLTGASESYYKGLVNVQKLLTTNLQLTDEQANKYTGFITQNLKAGQSVEEALYNTNELVATIASKTGVAIPLKDIMEEISNSSEATMLQFGRLPGNLELATVKAKSLGFSLDAMAKVGTQMLDIESSIGKELEYQLLSGHRLIGNEKTGLNLKGKSLTNVFRESALKGDMSTQADALNAILTQEGKVLENNLFARQKMADLLGMDEATLARAIQKRKILDKSGASDLFNLTGDELTSAATTLVKNGQMKAEDFQTLMENNDTRTASDKMDEQIDLLTLIASGTFFQKGQSKGIMNMDTDIKTFFTSLKENGADAMFKPTTTQAKNIGQISSVDDRKKAGSFPVDDHGNFIAAKDKKPVTDANDLIATPTGNSNKILLAGEDTFKLNKNDTVVAGTDLMGGKGGSDNSAGIIAAIQAGFRGAEVKIDESILLRWS